MSKIYVCKSLQLFRKPLVIKVVTALLIIGDYRSCDFVLICVKSNWSNTCSLSVRVVLPSTVNIMVFDLTWRTFCHFFEFPSE